MLEEMDMLLTSICIHVSKPHTEPQKLVQLLSIFCTVLFAVLGFEFRALH
jgi:hypothetical protein